MNTKQVIVMRRDLNMRKGKLVAQGAHASMKVFFDLKKCVAVDPPTLQMTITPEMLWWLTGSFAKICVYVNSEKELLEIYDAALEEGLPRALITDSGKTEFHGVPTNTCIAIGPAEAKKIDVVTGHLPLL